MTQWREMTAAEGAASRQQADAGYRKIPLRAQAGEYREGAQRKCVQNETTLQLWTRRRRAGDWFILGRLCSFPFLFICFLFFFLLLCCFCFCFVFSALGQADITPLRGRHKKAATVLRPHRMKMSTTTTTTVPFQRIAN